jgi:hypothetical protein
VNIFAAPLTIRTNYSIIVRTRIIYGKEIDYHNEAKPMMIKYAEREEARTAQLSATAAPTTPVAQPVTKSAIPNNVSQPAVSSAAQPANPATSARPIIVQITRNGNTYGFTDNNGTRYTCDNKRKEGTTTVYDVKDTTGKYVGVVKQESITSQEKFYLST